MLFEKNLAGELDWGIGLHGLFNLVGAEAPKGTVLYPEDNVEIDAKLKELARKLSTLLMKWQKEK